MSGDIPIGDNTHVDVLNRPGEQPIVRLTIKKRGCDLAMTFMTEGETKLAIELLTQCLGHLRRLTN